MHGRSQLGDDPIIEAHLSDLYDTLLQQNLCRLLEPFSRVEISHIARLIDLPQQVVENKCAALLNDLWTRSVDASTLMTASIGFPR
eukprot:COSAG05_NODE_140_length_16665_cov_48.470059_5_plen_86_part_00